jgi:putative ABC transport system ATP-binding protein
MRQHHEKAGEALDQVNGKIASASIAKPPLGKGRNGMTPPLNAFPPVQYSEHVDLWMSEAGRRTLFAQRLRSILPAPPWLRRAFRYNESSSPVALLPSRRASSLRMTPVVQVEDATKVYRVGLVDVPALRGVSLAIEKGEFVSLVGASGSGKSTLLHIIGGLTPATSGRVSIEGREYGSLSDAQRTEIRRRSIGFVFQKFNLLPSLDARGNIEIAQEIAGRNDAAYRDDLVRRLGIADRLDHRPSQLSGGEQQRVAIARALVNRPRILLADEPTGNLDSKNSEAVLQVLAALNRELGQTIMMITHNPDAAAVGHRILHMRDGQIVG